MKCVNHFHIIRFRFDENSLWKIGIERSNVRSQTYPTNSQKRRRRQENCRETKKQKKTKNRRNFIEVQKGQANSNKLWFVRIACDSHVVRVDAWSFRNHCFPARSRLPRLAHHSILAAQKIKIEKMSIVSSKTKQRNEQRNHLEWHFAFDFILFSMRDAAHSIQSKFNSIVFRVIRIAYAAFDCRNAYDVQSQWALFPFGSKSKRIATPLNFTELCFVVFCISQKKIIHSQTISKRNNWKTNWKTEEKTQRTEAKWSNRNSEMNTKPHKLRSTDWLSF